MPSYQVAELLGHGSRAVKYMEKSFNVCAFVGLYEKHRPGKRYNVPLDSLDHDLREGPQVLGHTENMWVCVLLRKHFSDHCEIEIGVRQCENIFHKLWFRLRRPRPMVANGDPGKNKGLKNSLNSLLLKQRYATWTAAISISMVPGIECGFPHEDRDPIVLQEPTRRGISVFSSMDHCTHR